MSTPTTVTRWSAEPMAWLVFALPATVVVAGLVTMVIAWRGHDGAVADDTYRQGLAIGEQLARGDTARRLQIAVGPIGAPVDDAAVSVTVRAAAPLPDEPRVELRWVHPARSGADRRVQLVRTGWFDDGRRAEYVGRVAAGEATTEATRWRYVLSSPTWRVDGEVAIDSTRAAREKGAGHERDAGQIR